MDKAGAAISEYMTKIDRLTGLPDIQKEDMGRQNIADQIVAASANIHVMTSVSTTTGEQEIWAIGGLAASVLFLLANVRELSTGISPRNRGRAQPARPAQTASALRGGNSDGASGDGTAAQKNESRGDHAPPMNEAEPPEGVIPD